jgi:hypothetical protein
LIHQSEKIFNHQKRNDMKKFTVILICFGFLTTNATSWRVNNNPAIDADFSDITTAISAASEGDTLYIEGTQYNYGDVTLNKPLVLIGPGFFLTENDSTQANQSSAMIDQLTIDPGAAGSTVYGLEFYDWVNINADNIVFSRNWMVDNHNIDCRFAQSSDITDVVITQNYLSNIIGGNNLANGLIISNNYVRTEIGVGSNQSAIIYNNVVGKTISAYNSVVKNNINTSNNDANGGYYDGGNNVWAYNIADFLKWGIPPGVGNIGDIDPIDVFVDYDGSLGYSADGKWQLKEGSMAIGYGENGVDCGIFGGPSPYILSGLPPVPHIYEAIVPVSGSAASGLSVTIKVKSQN